MPHRSSCSMNYVSGPSQNPRVGSASAAVDVVQPLVPIALGFSATLCASTSEFSWILPNMLPPETWSPNCIQTVSGEQMRKAGRKTYTLISVGVRSHLTMQPRASVLVPRGIYTQRSLNTANDVTHQSFEYGEEHEGETRTWTKLHTQGLPCS